MQFTVRGVTRNAACVAVWCALIAIVFGVIVPHATYAQPSTDLTITGIATDAVNGLGVMAEVTLYDCANQSNVAYSDANGNYSLTVTAAQLNDCEIVAIGAYAPAYADPGTYGIAVAALYANPVFSFSLMQITNTPYFTSTPEPTATMTATPTATDTDAPTITNTPAVGTGTGLLGEYYDAIDATLPFMVRVNPVVNFNWRTSAPRADMGVDTFRVVWTGWIQAKFTGLYTFTVTSDDGVRLTVNNQLIINQWRDQAATAATGSIEMQGGPIVPIRLEYYENRGSASVVMRWSSAQQPLEVVPTSQLYPATASQPTITRTNTSTPSITFTPSRTVTRTPTRTPSMTLSPTMTFTRTPSQTFSPTPTQTNTASPTFNETDAFAMTETAIASAATHTPTDQPTNTPTTTLTPTITATLTGSRTPANPDDPSVTPFDPTFTLAPSLTPVRAAVRPINDVHVRSLVPDINYPAFLYVGNQQFAEGVQTYESYLTFDITGVPYNRRVVLELIGFTSGSQPLPVGVYSVADTSWQEERLTWNTRPATSAEPLSVVEVLNTPYSEYQWDVTDYVRAELAAGRTTVSFALKPTDSRLAVADFNHDELSFAFPELILQP